MTSKREKFFRRRVLNKLFPREDESETDSDASDQQRTTLRSTEREEFKELPAEGRKRKLSESKEGERGIFVLEEEQSSSLHTSQPEEDKQKWMAPSVKLFASSEQPSLARSRCTNAACAAQLESGDETTQKIGSEFVDSSEKESKPTKNQKRKMKKKRRKERMLSERTNETSSGGKEFTCDTYQTS